MKEIYCWRCDKVLPMLDEEEFGPLNDLLRSGIRRIKEERQTRGLSLAEVDKAMCYQAALEYYERLTGHKETDPEALWHHCLAMHGPPCPKCGITLRKPQARICFHCGNVKE